MKPISYKVEFQALSVVTYREVDGIMQKMESNRPEPKRLSAFGVNSVIEPGVNLPTTEEPHIVVGIHVKDVELKDRVERTVHVAIGRKSDNDRMIEDALREAQYLEEHPEIPQVQIRPSTQQERDASLLGVPMEALEIEPGIN